MIPDRNQLVPDHNIPFSLSRNIEFVFPSGLPAPILVPSQKIQVQEWLERFPDRLHPYPSPLVYFSPCDSSSFMSVGSSPIMNYLISLVVGFVCHELDLRDTGRSIRISYTMRSSYCDELDML
jgi:hypothetical protein